MFIYHTRYVHVTSVMIGMSAPRSKSKWNKGSLIDPGIAFEYYQAGVRSWQLSGDNSFTANIFSLHKIMSTWTKIIQFLHLRSTKRNIWFVLALAFGSQNVSTYLLLTHGTRGIYTCMCIVWTCTRLFFLVNIRYRTYTGLYSREDPERPTIFLLFLWNWFFILIVGNLYNEYLHP